MLMLLMKLPGLANESLLWLDNMKMTEEQPDRRNEIYERHPQLHPINVGFDLAEIGMEAVIDKTENGRDVLLDCRTGIYSVQPHNDNYWIEVESLEKAHDAFYHPEKYR